MCMAYGAFVLLVRYQDRSNTALWLRFKFVNGRSRLLPSKLRRYALQCDTHASDVPVAKPDAGVLGVSIFPALLFLRFVFALLPGVAGVLSVPLADFLPLTDGTSVWIGGWWRWRCRRLVLPSFRVRLVLILVVKSGWEGQVKVLSLDSTGGSSLAHPPVASHPCTPCRI